MDNLHKKDTPIQEIKEPLFAKKGVRLFLKRDDLLFDIKAPDFNGNKWRKMKYNLLAAQKQNVKTLLTFGGAYSNHIAATAAAAAATVAVRLEKATQYDFACHDFEIVR